MNQEGISLFDRRHSDRVYMFSGNGNYVMGLIDGKMKYIYDFNQGREELYDLAVDPYEHHNLSFDPIYGELMGRGKLRLQAWISFQNPYLARFAPASSSGER